MALLPWTRADTTHDVMGNFFPAAAPDSFENINALEAIPEPASLGLLIVGSLIAACRHGRSESQIP